MKFFGLISIFLLLLSLNVPYMANEHGIYISVVKIVHKKTEPTASIFMKVFTDDLIDVLKSKFGEETISEKVQLCETYDKYLNLYFNEGFICSINNEEATYLLTNCERMAEVYLLEFSMKCPLKWDSVIIEAPFFMELFPNQSNIVHIETGNVKRFGRATKGNEILRIRF